MNRILARLRPSPAMVVACTALLFAMTGAGYAAGMVGPNTIGTKQIKNSSITGLDVKNKSLTAADFRGSIRGARGLAGAAGPIGPAGAPGQQGPASPGAQWATVNSAGTIVRQSGGITGSKVQTGGYVVTFPEVVSGHLILVTPALASDLTTRGAAIAGPCGDFVASCGAANIARSVTVFTMSATGTQQDHAFTVAQMGPNSTTASVSVNGAARSERLDSR